MNDIMIDLETIGTKPDAICISLGAVLFSPEAGKIGPTFYMPLDIEDQMAKGRKMDASTLKWWMGQSGAAKKVFHEQAQPTQKVLMAFAGWLNANSTKRDRAPWGNGATFDISIMESMYRDFGIDIPWTFNKIMDLRTFKRFVANKESLPKPGVNHHALDDALAQANYVIKHYQTLKEMEKMIESIVVQQSKFSIEGTVDATKLE